MWGKADMLFDCVIVGEGPSGLNASLVLAKAKRNTFYLMKISLEMLLFMNTWIYHKRWHYTF